MPNKGYKQNKEHIKNRFENKERELKCEVCRIFISGLTNKRYCEKCKKNLSIEKIKEII